MTEAAAAAQTEEDKDILRHQITSLTNSLLQAEAQIESFKSSVDGNDQLPLVQQKLTVKTQECRQANKSLDDLQKEFDQHKKDSAADMKALTNQFARFQVTHKARMSQATGLRVAAEQLAVDAQEECEAWEEHCEVVEKRCEALQNRLRPSRTRPPTHAPGLRSPPFLFMNRARAARPAPKIEIKL